MSIALRKDPRTVLPDFIDWFEEPFLTLRPYLGQAIRIEDYTEDGRYVIRAEIAGIDPDQDLDISVADRYLTLRAQRTSVTDGKHRSEFRYGAFSRVIELPEGADTGDIKAAYVGGIVTITVGLKSEQPAAVTKIPVATQE